MSRPASPKIGTAVTTSSVTTLKAVSSAPTVPVAMPAEQNELVTSTLPLVGHLVREMLNRVPSHVSRDDLTSAGMMALVVSAQNFDPSRGVPFARFAALRIRGALMDELRGMDWAARSVRGRARDADSVRTQLAAALGRTPNREETAAAMGISVAELDALNADLDRANVLSLQGFAPETGAELLPDNSAGPEAMLLSREKLGYLHDAINELPERLRVVVTAYFFDQRQMTDIAAELGVTESRVSQMRAEALKMLRDGMNSQLEPDLATPVGTGRGAAQRAAYYAGIANRSSLVDRLARTSAMGDVAVPVSRQRATA
jgi:RNA polymerase sigma factor for flagellar operon FliA